MTHVVAPQPAPNGGEDVVHLLLVQNPQDGLSTALITAYDLSQTQEGPDFQLAFTTNAQFLLDQLILGLGLTSRCFPPGRPMQCQAWYDQNPILLGWPVELTDGSGITLQLGQPQHDPETDEGSALLQLGIHSLRPKVTLTLESLIPLSSPPATTCERLTTASVAHEQWPQGGESPRRTTGVRLKIGPGQSKVPDYLEVPFPATEVNVEAELLCWGHQCRALKFGGHDDFLCLPTFHEPVADVLHIMYCTEEGIEPDAVILHTHSGHTPNDLEHMKLLHKFGFLKTAIVRSERLFPDVLRVTFVHHQPELAPRQTRTRSATPLPTPWPRSCDRPWKSLFCPDRVPADCGNCRLKLGIEIQDLHDLFQEEAFPLCRTFDDLQLPETTAHVRDFHPLHDLRLHDFDRLLIYTDGSSISGVRHQPPLLSDLQGLADTWAFLVLGEVYHEDHSQYFLWGWQAQPVHYQEDSRFHIGAMATGSDIAEKEALFWAAVWRISINLDIPTVFCSDSATTCGQARGELNANDYSVLFVLLRSAFQTLETILPGQLLVQHVHGHANDPWNDFVDFAAKSERDKSYYLPRPPSLDFRKWRKVFPSLWMLFSHNDGLPVFTRQGFDAPAPCLPETKSLRAEHLEDHEPLFTKISIDLSLSTVNVLSLSRGPQGHGGRVDYIRSQFRSLCLNILGLQETRSSQGVSCADDVLRISSGALKGHFGVELWVNLKQPYGYADHKRLLFHRRHFAVRHADPRLLLVHVDAPKLDCLVLVAHAPHSGQRLQERLQWWDQCRELCTHHRASHDQPLFVLIDANAASGPRDDVIVGPLDDSARGNTAPFRQFLEVHALCLPSTFQCHSGITTTWTSPAGDLDCRIDHVVVPQEFRDKCIYSTVVEDFDTGHAHLDHSLVGVQLQWSVHECLPGDAEARPKKHDREQIRSGHSHDYLATFTVEDWSQNVETQVDNLNHHLQTVLASHHPVLPAAPKKPYIDDEIWHLRTQKLDCRKQLKALHRRVRLEILYYCWKLWRKEEVAHGQVERFRVSVDCARVRQHVRLHSLALHLRARLRTAKQDLLRQRLDELPSAAPAGQILRTVHRFHGPTNPKKVKRRPFPMLRKEDGTICHTGQEVRDRWIEFFGNMEGAQRLPMSSLCEQWIANLKRFQQPSFELMLSDLPSLCDLERSFFPGYSWQSCRLR